MLLKWLVSRKERDALSRELVRVRQDYQECQEACLGVRTEYNALAQEHDALGSDYALVVGLAKRALALLLEVDTTRTGGMTLFRKRTDLMREAGAAGLLEKAQGEEESDATTSS